MRKGVIIFIVSILSCACSIKLDRTGCPCQLRINSGDVSVGGNVLVNIRQDGQSVYYGIIEQSDFESGTYLLDVPRKKSEIFISRGLKNSSPTEDGILIDLGNNCDSLYNHYAVYDLKDDYEIVLEPYHKDFTTLTLVLSNCGQIAGRSSVRTVVESNVAGIDLYRNPLPGQFSTEAYETSGTDRLFRIPRQSDPAKLTTTINIGDTSVEMPLGSFMIEAGYDFKADDLKDVRIELNYATLSVSIKIADMEDIYWGSIEI